MFLFWSEPNPRVDADVDWAQIKLLVWLHKFAERLLLQRMRRNGKKRSENYFKCPLQSSFVGPLHLYVASKVDLGLKNEEGEG